MVNHMVSISTVLIRGSLVCIIHYSYYYFIHPFVCECVCACMNERPLLNTLGTVTDPEKILFLTIIVRKSPH